MSAIKKLQRKRARRAERVRSQIRKSGLPRVSVFRSLKHISAQLIDDATGKTLAAATTQSGRVTGDKKERAKAIGLSLAQQAKEQGIERVTFDRGPYLYHGRVAALAQGLREGNLQV